MTSPETTICANITHMDKLALGRRVAQARDAADITQEGLARAVGLDRTAITRLEKGERKLNVPELVSIAQALGRPLSFFVDAPVSAVVSRRTDLAQRTDLPPQHGTSRALDIELDQFAADVRVLLQMDLIAPVERTETSIPDDHDAAEQMASDIRRILGIGIDAVKDLGETCEGLGLYTYSAPLGKSGPDGACVEVTGESLDLGAAVISGDAPAGRRRMTLAHELGHWLFGDAYDSSHSPDRERMINSFAIHFLAPRAGITRVWNQHQEWCNRDRALAVGAAYRLSWSAILGQLTNVGILDHENFRSLSESEPRYGDYLRLGLTWKDELESPYVSPAFIAACVNGYVDGKLTESRTLELLRGTLAATELPKKRAQTLDDLRGSFTGHDG